MSAARSTRLRVERKERSESGATEIARPESVLINRTNLRTPERPSPAFVVTRRSCDLTISVSLFIIALSVGELALPHVNEISRGAQRGIIKNNSLNVPINFRFYVNKNRAIVAHERSQNKNTPRYMRISRNARTYIITYLG